MNPKTIVKLVIAAAVLILICIALYPAVGYIDAKEWVFVQPYWGTARIQNGSGMYWKGFASTFAYERYVEFAYNDQAGEGERDKESIRVTFNDGSTANINSRVVVQTPDTEEKQLAFHRMMNGSQGAIKSKVKAYLTECLKSTAPLMSSTEHQTSLKTTFSRHVEDQFTVGLYDMKQVQKTLLDRTDAEGKPVTVEATEIVLDNDGKKVIAKESPITKGYGMVLTQFSIEGTEYDPETLLQFKAKKEQFLAAATSKAEREAMVQEALKIEAEGLKDKAQAEAEANVLKATAVIAAEQKAEVAMQAKVEAETKAEMALSVSETAMKEAQVKLDTAKLDAEAIIELAKAEREKIELAGALTELETAMIDAKVQMAKDVAEGISKIQVPAVMFMGGSADGGGQNIMENLINLKLLLGTGVLDQTTLDKSVVKRVIDRTAKVEPAPTQ